jgi:competence protein ComEC
VVTVQTAAALAGPRIADRWWDFVDAERDSLALWLPVAFAAGIAAWFGLAWEGQRLALAVALAGLAAAELVLRWRPVLVAALLAALLALAGMGVAEWR